MLTRPRLWVRGRGPASRRVGRIALAGLCLAGGLLLAGCFEIEESMALNRDLSGKAGLMMSVDFEPMVLTMLRMQRESEGKKGEPSADEIAKAKSDFLASRKSENEPEKFAAGRAELEKKLPAGIKLLDAKFEDKGLKMVATFAFSFDHVSKLAELEIPSSSQNPQKNPIDKPFSSLKVVDQGDSLVITSRPNNPVEKEFNDSEGNAEAKAMLKDAFKNLRIAFKIEAPWQVAESNATRRDGQTLYWEYDLAAFERMAKEKTTPEGIRVVFKK